MAPSAASSGLLAREQLAPRRKQAGEPNALVDQDGSRRQQRYRVNLSGWTPNEMRLSCGALKKDSFHNLRAPPASSAC